MNSVFIYEHTNMNHHSHNFGYLNVAVFVWSCIENVANCAVMGGIHSADNWRTRQRQATMAPSRDDWLKLPPVSKSRETPQRKSDTSMKRHELINITVNVRGNLQAAHGVAWTAWTSHCFVNDCTLYDFLCGLVVNFVKVSTKSLSQKLILYICHFLNDDMGN